MPKVSECPNCGRELEAGRSFCSSCGAAAVQSPAVAAMIQDARQALATNPDDTSARYNLAIAYKLGGMDDMALQELARVAEMQPDFEDAHYEMGLLHAKHGRKEQAIAALTCARELDPGDERVDRLLKKLEAQA
jgi:Flp pilus assembly protein TadD